MPQADINYSLNIQPSEGETLQAISQLSRGKASGFNTIPVAIYKAGGAAIGRQTYSAAPVLLE